MNDLQAVGARPFFSRAYFSTNLSSNGNSVYRDSFNLRFHPQPTDNINSIPEGTQTTYDGRTF